MPTLHSKDIIRKSTREAQRVAATNNSLQISTVYASAGESRATGNTDSVTGTEHTSTQDNRAKGIQLYI